MSRELHQLELVNRSGYPFQIGLQHRADKSTRWRVLVAEHPWLDLEDGNEQKFIDFVLARRIADHHAPREAANHLSLVVECKKVLEKDWIFLLDRGVQQSRRATRSRVISRNVGPDALKYDDWCNVPFLPESAISEYCVVEKGGNPPSLEPVTAEIARAADALAKEERQIADSTQHPMHRIYTPVIVTTAPLYICEADFSKVNLESGSILTGDVKRVNFVRFTKTLGRARIGPATRTVADSHDTARRSAIIVNAQFFDEFLELWDLAGLSTELAEFGTDGVP